jgi:L-lysine exporter family protein LysE/ArgO
LILAIDAQNAFVLKQGLKKQHVFLISLICAVSDAILIALGVSGFAVIVSEFPLIERIARYGGAAFLIIYALRSFNSAYKNTHAMQAAAGVVESAWKVAITCLALTWLNPHVYLDTVFLLGSISTQYSDHKGQFTVGAILASFVFFSRLGMVQGFLSQCLKSPVHGRY